MSAPATGPKLIGFLCNWCAYAGADKAGSAQLAYPPNLHAIRVMCTGRVDPQWVVDAFARGADGVLIVGCHPGDCHYKEQNYRALARQRILAATLKGLGVEPGRFRFEFIAAGCGDKFSQLVAEATASIEALGQRRADEARQSPGG